MRLFFFFFWRGNHEPMPQRAEAKNETQNCSRRGSLEVLTSIQPTSSNKHRRNNPGLCGSHNGKGNNSRAVQMWWTPCRQSVWTLNRCLYTEFLQPWKWSALVQRLADWRLQHRCHRASACYSQRQPAVEIWRVSSLYQKSFCPLRQINSRRRSLFNALTPKKVSTTVLALWGKPRSYAWDSNR